MNIIPIALAAHYDQGTTTLATCWKATLANGTVYGFTSTDRDITFEGVLYEAATGFTPSAIVGNANLAVDNMEVAGCIDSETMTEADLFAGLWDYATIEIFEVNYADLTQGARKLSKGTLGEVSLGRNSFVAELRGMAQRMQQVTSSLYTPTCRAELFSTTGQWRCNLDRATFTVTGAITAVTDRQNFTDTARAEAADWFKHGKITWTGGDNAGLSMEIKAFSAGAFQLHLPMPYDIQIGDTYSMEPGCNKIGRTGDCKIKFNNYINFRGEEDVPGADAIMQVGGL